MLQQNENFEVSKPYITRRRYINCRGKLIDLSSPLVMGIINLTPDSFFYGSRFQSKEEVLKRAEEILEEGGSIVDLGACSTRPGADLVTIDEEIKRLMPVLELIRKKFPELIISIDTYRSEVAKKTVLEGEADIINDISGGEMDEKMHETVAAIKVPYILMHMQGTPSNMQNSPTYKDVVSDISLWLSKKVDKLKLLGIADIIIDPGFGFGKTIAHNYQLLSHLEEFALFELPLMVGLSRKSMIYSFLNTKVGDSLNGSTVLNTIALMKGANILRVHDVKEAVESIKLVTKLNQENKTL